VLPECRLCDLLNTIIVLWRAFEMEGYWNVRNFTALIVVIMMTIIIIILL
jgi:hypothetical protein